VELEQKRVMVIGLGVSGRAAARFLAARGARLVMTDRRETLMADNSSDRLPVGTVYLGPEDPAWLEGVELVVVSPGVPLSSTLVAAARAAAIPVIGELELGSRFVTAPIVAVTGTNGKSTVTMLIAEICRAAGRKTFAGGNLGTPLVEAAAIAPEVAVVEVSSYQLETIVRFKPAVAVHLNLTDDHLDRYRDRDEYGRAKARIFENQDASEWAILNRDDPEVWRLAAAVRARVFSFGLERPGRTPALWREADAIAFDDGARRGTIGLRAMRLPGAHNLLNAMAAVGAALALGIAPAIIEGALGGFKGLPHRLEPVGEKGGVAYIDDSKGTNVGAVVEALAAVRAPVVLIAGGVDKLGAYEPLRGPLAAKVKLLILIGAARARMNAALAGTTAIECVATLAEAVALAARRTQAGDTVLLSPACASFDQFKDYAERGRIFQELVRAL
jgi:UDP-N-acetylmuramoylalanine--D-glutamate ligase